MKVRNKLHKETEYQGRWVDAYDRFCPCRPCFSIYHFPIWFHGKRVDNFCCRTREVKGCPDPLPKPVHIFYNSRRFQKRKPGDRFKCLRCGQIITFTENNDFDYIVVDTRDKEKIREYLKEGKYGK